MEAVWDHQRWLLAWEALDGPSAWQSDDKMSVKIALRWLHDLAGFGKVADCETCREIGVHEDP